MPTKKSQAEYGLSKTPEQRAEDEAYMQSVIARGKGKKQCKSRCPEYREYRCDQFEGHSGPHAYAELKWER